MLLVSVCFLPNRLYIISNRLSSLFFTTNRNNNKNTKIQQLGVLVRSRCYSHLTNPRPTHDSTLSAKHQRLFLVHDRNRFLEPDSPINHATHIICVLEWNTVGGQ